jgi:hypothetical protein
LQFIYASDDDDDDDDDICIGAMRLAQSFKVDYTKSPSKLERRT